MNLLVVGNGGREHALAWRLAQSDRVTKVFVAPGNAGTAVTPRLENLPITAIDKLIEFVKANNIAFTVVGPEAPLAAVPRRWPSYLWPDSGCCSARKL